MRATSTSRGSGNPRENGGDALRKLIIVPRCKHLLFPPP
jgi:hypothetical protein